MSKHISPFSKISGPDGRVLTDYILENIPALWSKFPERIENVTGTSLIYTGDIPDEDFDFFSDDKLFLFSPHVPNSSGAQISISGSPLLTFKSPDAVSTPAAGSISPSNQYTIRLDKEDLKLIIVSSEPLVQLPFKSSIATASPPSDFATINNSSSGDKGGMTWKRVVSYDPALPAYFRQADFNGNLYEAVVKNQVSLESAVGSAATDGVTDNGPAINSIQTWLGTKGGGSLILPAGIIIASTPPQISASGVLLSGWARGSSQNDGGTILSLTNPSAGAKALFGNDSATQAQCCGIRDLRLLGSGGAGKLIQTLNLRTFYANNISLNNSNGGALEFGSSTRATYFYFLSQIEGNCGGTLDHLINHRNCLGGAYAHHVHLEGPSVPVAASVGLSFPANAIVAPDGFNWADSHFGLVDHGLRLDGGLANGNFTDITFDRVGATGIYINTILGVRDVEFTNTHLKGYLGGGFAGTPNNAIVVNQNGGNVSGLRFTSPRIAYFGQIAIWLVAGDKVRVINPNLTDVCCQTTNTYPAVKIESTFSHFEIKGLQISNDAQALVPTYIVQNLGLSQTAEITPVKVINLVPGTGYISDPKHIPEVRTLATGNIRPTSSTFGTDTTPVVTETYIAEITIPAGTTVTGVALLNGSAVAGNVKLALADSSGLVLRETASTAASGTAAFQRIALTNLLYSHETATYYILLQCNNTSNRFRSLPFGNFGSSKKTGEVFGTWTQVTPPTTFTPDLGPVVSLY